MTQLLAEVAGQQVAQVAYTPKEIIFNVLHPSIHLYIEDLAIKKILIMFIQEIKRDIIYRRMQNCRDPQK